MTLKIEKRCVVGCSLELRAEGPKLVGYAAKFDSRSELIMGYFYEQIAKGAFQESLQEDDIRALVDHNSTLVLGRNRSGTLKLKEDELGLRVEISPPDTQYARDLIAVVKRGDISGMSFAFITKEDGWEFKEDVPPLRTLKKVSINDVSVVTYPAYAATEIDVRSWEKAKADYTGYPTDTARRRLRVAEVG